MLFKKRKGVSRVYLKWLAIICAVALVPAIILAVYTYAVTMNEKNRIANEMSDVYLEQVSTAANVVLSQIENSYAQLAIKRNFVHFETSYTGRLYENARQTGESYDLSGLQEYFSMKSLFMEDIVAMRGSNTFIDSIYFYDTQKNIVLTDRQLSYPFADFPDKDWYNAALKDRHYPAVVIDDEKEEGKASQKHMIRLIFRSPNIADNMLVVNISGMRLFPEILQRLPEERYEGLTVFGRGDVPLYYSDEENAAYFTEFIPSLSEERKGRLTEGRGADSRVILHLREERYGLLYMTSLSQDEIYGSARSFQIGFIAILCTILAIACVLILFASRRFYKPYQYLLEKLGKGDIKADNEMKLIEDIVDQVVGEKETLLNQLESNREILRERFLESLVRGNLFEMEKIRDTLKFLEIELPLSNLFLTVFDLRHDGFVEPSYEDMAASQLIVDRIVQMIADRFVGVVVQTGFSECVLIVHLPPEEREHMVELAKQVITSIALGLEIKCHAAVSRPCATIKHLPQMYGEAVDLLRANSLMPEERVFVCGDTKLSRDILPYPEYEMRSLCENIAYGNREKALMVFSQVKEKVESVCEDGHVSAAKHILIRMFADIADLAARLGQPIEKIVGESEDIYAALLKISDLQLIFEYFLSIIETLLWSRENKTGESNKYICHIIDMLREDCGPDVSLSVIADKLGLSPTYISRLFKSNMGVTFMDYLTKVRMEKAKELLAEPRAKVKDVAMELGYSNADYFIRLFRNHTNMTPSEYKKIIE